MPICDCVSPALLTTSAAGTLQGNRATRSIVGEQCSCSAVQRCLALRATKTSLRVPLRDQYDARLPMIPGVFFRFGTVTQLSRGTEMSTVTNAPQVFQSNNVINWTSNFIYI